MKNLLFIFLMLMATCFSQAAMAQAPETKKKDPNHFDEKAARAEAKTKGIKPSELEGYIQFLQADFSSKRSLEKGHKHSPYENAEHVNERVIYINGDNKPMNIGCPNAGFENYDFTGWTGEVGTYSGSQAAPVYALTPGIVSTAGNNTPLGNTINNQTILSIPPTNPNYPVCAGYDSIACPAGGPLISQIPFISPYSLDGVSCRLLGAFGGAEVSKLKYVMSVTSTNKLFSYSYAIVLNDGHSTDPTTHQPYFKVTVKDQNGNTISGCQSYYQDATGALTDTSFKSSHLPFPATFGLPVVYRPWRLVSIDLSSPVHASVTSISIEFEVAGCSAGGHLGYAYVDAECGSGGISAAFCSGTNAVLTAPSGYTNYQWFDNTGSPIAAPTGTNPVLTVPSPVVGNTYSVSMSTPGGCTVTLTKTITVTNVSILNVNSAPSCAGGNSGVATVVPAGSTGVYSYTWTSVPGGSVVSTSQTATNLAPGSYSVLVSSPTCGQASANLSVGTSPPFYMNQTRNFCGNSTFIPQPGGSNYLWYHGSALIAAPVGTNDTLYIPNASAGDLYTVVYKNASGCKDSLIYSLNQIAGGSSYFSNTTNVCPGNSNGSTVLNLNTPFPAAPTYSYLVTGPSAATTVTNTTTTAGSITVTPLAPGTYTAIVNDGTCIYNNTITIGTIQTNFTITPTNTVLCFPEEAVFNLSFGNLTPSSCGLSANGTCSSPNIIQVGNGTTVNTSFSSPAPYGNYDKNRREQYLFTASELLTAGLVPGNISSISFSVSSMQPLNTTGTSNSATYIGTLPNYSVKMKCTSATSLSDFENAGLQQVYFGNYTPVVGSNTHNFTQAYTWDGVSSLIVDICYTRTVALSSTYYTSNPISPNTNTGTIKTVYFSSDGTPACGNPNGITSTDRPNIKFGNCAAISASDYSVAVSPNGSITANYGNDSIRVAPTFSAPPLPTGSVVYTFSVTNPIGGCVATKTVEILYPPLTTTINSTSTNTTLCEGGNTTLSATGAFNYNWYYQQGVGGALTPIATSSSITVTPPAVGSNTYVVTGNSSCPSSIADTSIITINVTPLANLIITPLADVNKCLNMPFVFNPAVGSTTLGNAGTPYTYSWTILPGNTPAPGTNSTSTYTTNSNTTTTLVVTVNGVCANSTADTVVVKNFADDLGITISNSLTICPNQTLTLNSTTTGGHAIYNYSWTVNSVPVSNSANLNYTSPSTGGIYNVVVTVIDSCSYQKTDTKVINVLPNTLNIAIVDSISLCGNTAFTLTSVSNGGYPAYTYNWYLLPDNNNSISHTTQFNYTTPEAEGIYTVQVVMKDSCGYQQSDYQLINILPPCQVEIPNVITPNGDKANEYFKIKNIEYHPNTKITIFDRWGLKIYDNNNYNNEWKAEGLNDGTYFYVVDVPDDKKYSGFVTVFKGQ